MTKRVKIVCVNNGLNTEVKADTSLLELQQQLGIESKYPILAAYVNNVFKDLNYRIYKPVTVQFIDISHFEGYRVYQRTISFILQKAVSDLYGQRTFYIRHTVGCGFYCEFGDDEKVTDDEIKTLRLKIQEVINRRFPIHHHSLPTAEVHNIYERCGYTDKLSLLHTRKRLYSEIYFLDDTVGYFYGALAPDTGYIHLFDIRRYHNGFYIALPTRSNPAELDLNVHWDRMLDVFGEYHEWVNIMGVPTVGHLNEKVLQGDASELIKIAEAFHEKKIANIADQILKANKTRGTKVVLLSGPSSSGKTTTSKRIGIQLRILGLDPVLISLDDYFVNRENTPRDESGDYDYEALEAIDLKLLNSDLQRLMAGESVDVPRYDFITGTRQWHEKPLKLNERSILIMEGIHSLNPRLTPSIPDTAKYRIYASCFTSVAMDNTSRIHTTDNRLLRRMIRDNATRGMSAADTIARWPSVRRGEERNIFPYQEEADVMFNSSLFYEIAVLKPFAEPLLREIPNTRPEYATAQGMLKFLDNFHTIGTDEIPPTSVLREFVGGSAFKY